jgi:hypothetical protein
VRVRAGKSGPECALGPEGGGWVPAGERDDAGPGAGVTELLVFQGELVDGADEGGDVSPELGECPVLAVDGLLEPGDGGAELSRAGMSQVRG